MLCKIMIMMVITIEITTVVGISAIVFRKGPTERPAATFTSTVTGSTPGVNGEMITI
jgi:hypothetical protein